MLRVLAIGLFGALVLLAVCVACLQLWHSVRTEITAPAKGAVRIASYNAHYIVLGDYDGPWSEAGWHARKDAMQKAVRALDADVIAFQEMESWRSASDGSVNLARDFLAAQNPDYAVAAVGDWRDFPSTQPIFYRKDRLNAVDQGWFFFSDTPDVIYSRTYNGSWPAYCTWVQFETQDGQRFHLFNVHYEYRSISNRRKSATLTAQRMAPVIKAGEPVFLVGDFNALDGAHTLRTLQDQGIRFLPSRGSTYHLNRGLHLFGAIDHIGYAGPVEAMGTAKVLQQKYDGVWPTDHHPVIADFKFQS